MITNLPLLFVKGCPTSLSQMTIPDMETFIPFLVHCSWGHDTAKKIQRPSWWPKNVPFSIPITRPKTIPKDWGKRLRELVDLCYKHHGSEFLLKFCDDLSKYPISALHFVNNCDSTTSLYLKSSHRLLVTFRNENMLYDKKTAVAHRKCLLPERQGTNSAFSESDANDIFQCDTCDRAFKKLDHLQKHERGCTRKRSSEAFPASPAVAPVPEQDYFQTDNQGGFLGLFGLNVAATESCSVSADVDVESTSSADNIETRERRTVSLNGLTNFPFSSPAGLRIGKTKFKPNEINAKFREQLDRYCGTPVVRGDRVRWFSKHKSRHFPVKYKKPDDYWNRKFVYPGQRNKYVLDLKSQLLFNDCKPCCVVMNCMTGLDIKLYMTRPKVEVASCSTMKDEAENDNDIEFISCTTLPKMPRSAIISKRKSLMKRSPKIKTNTSTNSETANSSNSEPVFIDLCSDDDDDQNENVHPSTAYPAVSDIVSHSLVLAATPEYLEPLNSSTELEGAQYQIKEHPPAGGGKSQLSNVQGHSRLKPLQQCQDNIYSSHVNNVISLD